MNSFEYFLYWLLLCSSRDTPCPGGLAQQIVGARLWCDVIANPDGNSTWQPVTLIPVERYCKWDTVLNLEEHCSVTELFCSSIFLLLIIFEVCQCLENNVQMPLALDLLCLPALAHFFVVTYPKVVISLHINSEENISKDIFQVHGRWKEDGCVRGWPTRDPCSASPPAALPWAPNTGSVSQTPPFSAQLRNSPPSHSAQQQPAGFVGLVSSEVPLSGHPHVWQALLVPKEPDSSRPGGPAPSPLSGSNCSPTQGKAGTFAS